MGVAAQGTEARFRAADLGDADAAVELIYAPMGKFADYLFGDDDPNRAREVLRELYLRGKNRFSHQYCDVAIVNGEVAGLLLSYPGSILPSLALPMGKELREIIGVKGVMRLTRRSISLMREKEAEPDEYYVFTVSVAPKYQKNGVGGKIMELAEAKARATGLKKVALGVTLDNENARWFYEHLGYEVIEVVYTPKLEKAIGYEGYYRIAKELP
jgi:ribosomal protein S18 acetylase RimI-like enzyme